MTTDFQDFQSFAAFGRERVETALDRCLPAAETHPSQLHQAMRYAVLGGGKRVRPLLTYAAGYALGVRFEALDAAACAVECIHAYSLVHDDLPAMDDDDLRRGQPTCHKVYGEAQAILAGDALQAFAFQLLAHENDAATAQIRSRMLELLAQSAGSRGMVGGQSIDLASVGQELDIAQLEDMHVHKTGALIRASVLIGAMLAPDAPEASIKSLDRFGKFIGLAFQVQDDVLDASATTDTLGKLAGADRALNKPNYVSLLGLGDARERARQLHCCAAESLQDFDQRADPLRGLAAYIVGREA